MNLWNNLRVLVRRTHTY